MKPVEITKENEMEIWQRKNRDKPTFVKKAYNLLEYVRISRISGSPFIKTFDQNWSEEIFRIVSIDSSAYPIMYIIEDLNHSMILGKFYKEGLHVTKPNIFRIEKIIRTKGKGKHYTAFGEMVCLQQGV